jgi:hypothetical protein
MLRAARKYARENATAKTPESATNLEVAVLGSYSTQYASSCLEYLLNDQSGERAQVFDGEYDSILSSILDDNSQLHALEPNILVLLPDTKDIVSFVPKKFASSAKITQQVDEVVQFYERLWAKAPARSTILQANFVLQNLRVLENLDANYAWSSRSFTAAVNLELMRRRPSNVLLSILSNLRAQLEKISGSIIPHVICTGMVFHWIFCRKL